MNNLVTHLGTVLACSVTLALHAPAAAQESVLPSDTSAPAEAQPPEAEWVSLFNYSESVSRTAFTSCDGNADDRLSIVEAAKTLHGFESVRSAEAFRGLDKDSDGYLHWPEFDRRFRELTERGAALLIRPSRDLGQDQLLAAEQPAVNTRGAQLHALLDQDSDGKLTLEEAQLVTRELELPETLVYMLGTMDLDRSGVISPQELAPMASLMPQAAAAAGASALPAEYRGADANGDASLDQEEIASLLQTFDPLLTRWADKILLDADASADGMLVATELAPPTIAPPAKPPADEKRGKAARRTRK